MLGEASGIELTSPSLEAPDFPVCDFVDDPERYVVDTVDRVLDRYTGLAWTRCPVGFVADDGATPLDSSDDLCERDQADTPELVWQQALSRADGLNATENEGWRLPNVKELQSLVNDCSSKLFATTVFPNTPQDLPFWSSTPVVQPVEVASAWRVHFRDGEIETATLRSPGYARAVRTTDVPPVVPRIGVAVEDAEVEEGNDGTVDLTFTISLSRPAVTTVTVGYSVASPNDFATPDVDFRPIDGSLTFAAGETQEDRDGCCPR